MFVYNNAPTKKVVRCSYIKTPHRDILLDVRVSWRLYREGRQMFVYHSAPKGKVVRCSYIIAPLQTNVVRWSHIIPPLQENAVRWSYIMTPLLGRLLDVPVSKRHCREGCQMFVYHNAHIGKVVKCACIITLLQGRQLDVRVS